MNIMLFGNETAPLNLCQEWKRIGGQQNTLYGWHQWRRGSNEELQWEVIQNVGMPESIAAPSVREMMEWLPIIIKKGGLKYSLNIWPAIDTDKGRDWEICYYNRELGMSLDPTIGLLPNALMEMVIQNFKEGKNEQRTKNE